MTPDAINSRWKCWMGAELSTLPRILWGAFLVWGTVGLVFLLTGTPIPESMRWADALFILLAAANITVAVAEREGWGQTAQALAWIAAGSALIEWIGVRTGWPFGSYSYTDRFGWRIAGVLPFTIPLAWWIILASGKQLLFPFARGHRWVGALLVASYATLLDFFLEPFAWHTRGYWIWHTPEVPLQNYLAWWSISFFLVAFAPWSRSPIQPPPDPRAGGIAFLMAATFVIGRTFAA